MLFARSAKYCALLAALVLPACSGGGMAKGIAIPQFESGTLALTFAAPAKTTTSHKQRTFLSPSTASISVTISGVATPVVANVASGSPNCTMTGSGRTCTIAIGAAPVGTDTFAITLYDGANATGNVLGTGSVASAVVSGTPFSAAVVADGIPGSIAISAGQTSFATGTAATTALTVAAQDVDGNTISGTYASPITLTNSDTTGAFTLSPATVTSSSQTVTLSYNGSAAVTADTISANVAGAKALNVTIQVTVSNATLPSPTASASPSPTPRSSPSSTASPSASAIPSPSPSPTAPPSPSPSPTASPSPSPSPSAIPSPSPNPSPTSAATIACNTPNPCQIYLSDPDAPGFMAGSNIAMVTPTETGYTGNFTWSPTVAGQTTQDCAALVNPSLSSSFTYTSAFTESPQTGTTFTFTQTQNVLAFDPGAYSGGVLASCDGTISDANGNTTILTIFLQGVGTM